MNYIVRVFCLRLTDMQIPVNLTICFIPFLLIGTGE